MKKIIKYFPLNKGIVEEEIKTLIKAVAIYMGTAIVVLTIANLTDWIPIVKNLTFNISNIYGYYILAGIGLACYQYFMGKDYSDEEFITLSDIVGLWNSSKGKIILGVTLVALCLIPHKGKVEPISVQTEVAKEEEIQESEVEISEVEEVISEKEVHENEETDIEEPVITEVAEPEKTYEVVLSEEMNYGEAEWINTSYEVEPGICVQYNKAMLNMTNSDRKYGNVIYIEEQPIALPIKMSEFFEIIGENATSISEITADSSLQEGSRIKANSWEQIPGIQYNAICISDDVESFDSWYIYGMEIQLEQLWDYDSETDSVIKVSRPKVVLPGGMVVSENIDLTLFYGLEENAIIDAIASNVVYDVYEKEGYSAYRIYRYNSKKHRPMNVEYSVDFIREAVPTVYETQYDAALATFEEAENYQSEVARLKEEVLLFGTSSEKHGSVLKIDGVEVKFPISLEEFKKLGFEIEIDSIKEFCPNGTLAPKKKINIKVKTADTGENWNLYVVGVNPASTDFRIEDIYLSGIHVKNVIGEPLHEIILPGNITLSEELRSVLETNLGQGLDGYSGGYRWTRSGIVNCYDGDYIIEKNEVDFTYTAFNLSDGAWDSCVRELKEELHKQAAE